MDEGGDNKHYIIIASLFGLKDAETMVSSVTSNKDMFCLSRKISPCHTPKQDKPLYKDQTVGAKVLEAIL